MRTKIGIVISDKQEKTVVVRVDRYVTHPKYQKKYRVSNKFHAHDEGGVAKEGDTITIAETTPISKLKRWKVIETQNKEKATPAKKVAPETITEETAQ